MLATWGPWLGLALAAASVALRADRATEPVAEKKLGMAAHAAGGFCILFGVIAALAGWALETQLPGAKNLGFGSLIGALVATAAGFLGSRFDPQGRNYTAPVAFGVAAAGASMLFAPADRGVVGWGVAFGLAIGSWILAIAPTLWPSGAAIAAAAVVATGVMGGFGYGDQGPQAGMAIGLAIVIASGVALLALPRQSGKLHFGPLVAAALILALGWLISSKVLFLEDAWKLVALGIGSALVVSWMLPDNDESPSTMPIALSLVVWLGVATIAFAMRRGFGMSICWLTAVSFLISQGRWRGAMSTAPVAALVCYRCLRELNPDAAKALDIGQHYGLLGLLIAASLIALAAEWRQSVANRFELKIAGAAMIWGVAIALLPAVIAIVLAAKGFVGAIAGLGIGVALVTLKGDNRPHAYALATGAAALMVAQYGWLVEKLDLTRDDKVKSLLYFAIALAALAGLIVWLSRNGANSSISDSNSPARS